MNKRLLLSTLCALSLTTGAVWAADTVQPQAGDTTQEQARQAEMSRGLPPIAATKDGEQLVHGWSVKDHVMGKKVYNEQNDKVGDIRDVILDGNGEISYYVVGVGGFLGVGEHDVAIAADNLSLRESADKDKDQVNFELRGYNKDQLKELPEVKVK